MNVTLLSLCALFHWSAQVVPADGVASTTDVNSVAPAAPSVNAVLASPSAVQVGARPPRPVTWDDRKNAATASGVSAFVGVVLGGLGIPAASGLALANVGGAGSQDVLLVAGVVGGAAGAAIGGAVGAVPTTTSWVGPLAVAGAAAAGSLVGLIPTALLGRSGLSGSSESLNDIAYSALLVTTMVCAAGAGAGAAALMAAPTELKEQS